MRSCFTQSVVLSMLACVGLFTFAWVGGTAEGADVAPPSLGGCVAGLEDQGDLAVKICEAKITRALMTPGSGRCAASARLVEERLVCSKSDSASPSAGAGTSFAPFPLGLRGPISIGDLEAFYAGRRAGATGRFQIVSGGAGRLSVKERVNASRSEEKCTMASGLHNCRVASGFAGQWLRQTRRAVTYTLQLDGLLITEETQSRRCIKQLCSPGGCSSQCGIYVLSVAQTSSHLHPWSE